MGDPTRSGNLAAWAHPFLPSGLRFFDSFAPTFRSFQKSDPRKVSGHLDVVWVPETSKYRKRGFLTAQG
jgi:hypothetical protein